MNKFIYTPKGEFVGTKGMSARPLQGLHANRIAILGVASIFGVGLLALPSPAFASTISGTHYLNNASGSNCSNAGPGTSQSAPWCDFTPVQNQTLAAGSQLLLARGSSWTQALKLSGSGTASSWITLGAYGAGSLPVIKGTNQASDRTVVLTNPDYWHVQNLELSNAGEGLVAEYTTLNHNGLDVHGLYAHDLSGIFDASPRQADFPDLQNSTGITISAAGAPTPGSGQSVLTGLSVRNNVTHNSAGVYLVDDPAINGTPAAPTSTFSNVDISDNSMTVSSAPMVAIEDASAPVFAGNRLDCSGHQAEPQGTTCVFVSHVDSADVINNTIYNMPDTNSPDETGIDFEYKVQNCVVRGNSFINNAGAGLELLQLGRSGDYSTGTVVSENLFYNDGSASSSQKGSIAVYGSGVNATIAHNSYQNSSNGFLSNVSGNPDTSQVSQADNVLASTEYPATWHFSGTQGNYGWHEQSYNGAGSSWSDMPTYNATSAQWSTAGGASIDAFTSTPGVGANQWVAREWIAPSTGSVVIRGQAAKDDGSAASSSVLIERNGTPVWPTTTPGTYTTVSAGDRAGVSADVSLSVAAGDVIRFVVTDNNASGAATSWTPSISYR